MRKVIASVIVIVGLIPFIWMDSTLMIFLVVPLLVAIVCACLSIRTALKNKSLKHYLITGLVVMMASFSAYILYKIWRGAWPTFIPHIFVIICCCITIEQATYNLPKVKRKTVGPKTRQENSVQTGSVIKDVPTDLFNQVTDDLQKNGWRLIEEYDGFDAWIDYGKLVLTKEGKTIFCEWTNWFEGEFHGERETLEEVRSAFQLPQLITNVGEPLVKRPAEG